MRIGRNSCRRRPVDHGSSCLQRNPLSATVAPLATVRAAASGRSARSTHGPIATRGHHLPRIGRRAVPPSSSADVDRRSARRADLAAPESLVLERNFDKQSVSPPGPRLVDDLAVLGRSPAATAQLLVLPVPLPGCVRQTPHDVGGVDTPSSVWDPGGCRSLVVGAIFRSAITTGSITNTNWPDDKSVRPNTHCETAYLARISYMKDPRFPTPADRTD